MKCPKCGSKRVVKEYRGVEIDPSHPETYILSEYEEKYDYEFYTVKCLDCGYEYEDWDQPGYKE